MDETVMAHLVEQVPTAHPSDNVEQVLRSLRQQLWASTQYVYVIDGSKRLVGTVSVRTLLASPNDATMSSLMERNLVVLHPHSDQERAGILAIQHHLKAIPVVTVGEWTFVGIVDANQIMTILHKEHTEDFLRMSGIQRGHPVVDIFQTSVLRLVRLRLPWLIVGFGGGLLATLLSGQFSETLEQHIELAFFIPLIVYMSGAVATQTETLYVRSLSMHEGHFLRHAWHEFLVGAVLGATMAVLVYGFAFVWMGSAPLASAIAIAMFANLSLATIIALCIPTVLFWMKKDPALGAGPFATVVGDVVSLLVYFAVTSAILVL